MRRTAALLLATLALGLLPGVPVAAASPRDRLAEIDRRLAGVVGDLEETRGRLARVRAARERSESELASARRRRQESAAVVRSLAVDAYKHGGDHYFAMVLLSESPDDLALRVSYASSVTRRQEAGLDALRGAVEDAEIARARLADLERSETQRLSQLETSRRDLASGQAEQRRLLVRAMAAASTTTPPAATSGPAPAARTAAAPSPAQSASPPGGTGSAFVVTCYSGGGSTATGTKPHAGTAAVDPAVLPLRSHFQIEGLGPFTAEDPGGAIRGNRVDIWHESEAWCQSFGRRTRNVTPLD